MGPCPCPRGAVCASQCQHSQGHCGGPEEVALIPPRCGKALQLFLWWGSEPAPDDERTGGEGGRCWSTYTNPCSLCSLAGPGGGRPLLLPQRGGECAQVAWRGSLATWEGGGSGAVCRRGWGLLAWAFSRSLSSLQGSNRTTWRAKCFLTSAPGDSHPWEVQEMQAPQPEPRFLTALLLIRTGSLGHCPSLGLSSHL